MTDDRHDAAQPDANDAQPSGPEPETSEPDDDQADADSSDGEPSALVSRLRVIEDQPLAARAGAYAQVHEELRSRLESGDVRRDG